MLKRITFFVILVVFAKPVYDEVSNFLDVYVPMEDVTVESAEPIKTAYTSEQQPIDAANQTEQIAVAQAVKPEKVENAEQLADAFFYHFSRLDTEFTIEYRGSTEGIERMLTRATEEASQRDTYIAGHLSNREMEYEYRKTEATIRVKQSYLTNPEQERVVEDVVTSIMSTVQPEAMSDFEKVKFVNDYIVKNTIYSEDSVASSHSAYAVAYEGKGVCQGYALFAQKLLQALGMESMYVVGEVYTGGHAWNLVKVDGQWYHLDTTWNDPVPDRGTGIRYDYFLLSDRDMRVDHSWEATAYPKAQSSTYSFMHVVQDSYEQGDYIYFSNSSDNNKLYKLSKTTGKIEKLADIRALYIVGAGEWLYFSNYSKGAYLAKIKLDGTELTTLFKEEVENLFIEEDYIYFTAESGAKKIAIEAY